MAKRIFSNSIEPPPTTLTGRTPTCYYHKLPILHFCTQKKCTLPLCKDCLPIHKKQHIKNKEMQTQGLVDFQKAREDALNAFEQRKEQVIGIQQRFKKKMMDYKHKMIDTITGILEKFYVESLARDGNIQIISEIDQRTEQIRTGSLKELIKYYQDTYGAEHFRKLYKLYNGEYLNNIKFEVNNIKLQDLCKQGIKDNNKQNKQQQHKIQTKQIKNIQEKSSKEVQRKDPFQKSIISQPKAQQLIIKSQENVNKDIIINKKTEHIYEANVYQMKPLESIKQPSQEEEQSEIFSYNLLKSKRAEKQMESKYDQKLVKEQLKPNIYTNHFIKNSTVTDNNDSHVTSINSKSKNKRKGLSLVRSHKSLHSILPLNTGGPFKEELISNTHNNVQHNNKKSNWRNFVKMGDYQDEKQSYMEYYQPSILNPKQMRDLIAKKKNEQKSKIQKEFKGNRSAQFLIPVSDKRSFN